MKKIFFLTSSIDEGVMSSWSFFSESKLEVMEHIIDNFWSYNRLFYDLNLDVERDRVTPRILLERIEKSRVSGDSDWEVQIHEFSESEIALTGRKRKSLLFGEVDDDTLEEVLKLKREFGRSDEDLFPDFTYTTPPFLEKEFEGMVERSLYIQDRSTDSFEYLLKIVYPLLNLVDFKTSDEVETSFRERIVAEFGEFSIGGSVNFLVVRKKSYGDITPLFLLDQNIPSRESWGSEQLALKLRVAMESSRKEIDSLVGVSIVRNIWEFVKVEKREGLYYFFSSESLSTDRVEHIKKIYINLLATRELYCK
jgi:hypothetical protein